MIREFVDTLYHWTALHMPLRWSWQYVYVMRARAYFECSETPGFNGWPWAWTAKAEAA